MRDQRVWGARARGCWDEPAWLSTRILFGLGFLALGVLWTLDNLGVMEAGWVIRWWPLLFVVTGLARLMGLGCARRPVMGAIFLGIGLVVLGTNFGLIPWTIWDLWPLFFVFFGAMLVRRSLRGPSDAGPRPAVRVVVGEQSYASGGGSQDDAFESVAIWSGVERKIVSQSLRRGEAIAIMGSAEIDLRGASPRPEGARVEAVAIMGGVDLIVPDDWRVVNEVAALMGSVEDSRRAPAAHSDKLLVLKGAAIMGGIEVKSAGRREG